MKFLPLLLTLLTAALAPASALEAPAADGLYAVLATDKGSIVLALEFEKTPLTVSNFVALAEGTMTGKPFYDGLSFHRVLANFMIQGGDPLGNGTGGPGYQFADEFDPSLRFTGPGDLAMANSGPDTNGSQFFITHVKTDWLNGKHTVFGHVVAGQKVVDAIAQGDLIRSVTIVRRGPAAEAFHPTKASFQALAASLAKKAAAPASTAGLDQYSEGTTVTDSGLRFKVLRAGVGRVPKAGQTVTATYVGRLTDGTVFDSSFSHPGVFQFTVGKGEVIKGWDEAFSTMHVGEKRLLVVPPALGYGNRAAGPIPPNSWLVFEVELVGIRG